MELRVDQPGEASLVQDGRVLLRLSVGEAGTAEFQALLRQVERSLCRQGPCRVVVTYQEGLLGPVHAEEALDFVFVEDDAHDVPPVQIRRRSVAADPEAVQAAISLAERRARQGGAR